MIANGERVLVADHVEEIGGWAGTVVELCGDEGEYLVEFDDGIQRWIAATDVTEEDYP